MLVWSLCHPFYSMLQTPKHAVGWVRNADDNLHLQEIITANTVVTIHHDWFRFYTRSFSFYCYIVNPLLDDGLPIHVGSRVFLLPHFSANWRRDASDQSSLTANVSRGREATVGRQVHSATHTWAPYLIWPPHPSTTSSHLSIFCNQHNSC